MATLQSKDKPQGQFRWYPIILRLREATRVEVRPLGLWEGSASHNCPRISSHASSVTLREASPAGKPHQLKLLGQGRHVSRNISEMTRLFRGVTKPYIIQRREEAIIHNCSPCHILYDERGVDLGLHDRLCSRGINVFSYSFNDAAMSMSQVASASTSFNLLSPSSYCIARCQLELSFSSLIQR